MVSVRTSLAKRTIVFLAALMGVSALGALSLGPLSIAQAADLNPYAYKGPSNSPYNDRDPRYAELYGPDDHDDKLRWQKNRYGRYGDVHRKHHDPAPRYKQPTYKQPAYKQPAYKHSDERYDLYRDPRHYRLERTYGHDRRYQQGRYHHDRQAWRRRGRFARAPHCVPRRVVMRRLFRDGWHDFHGLEFRGAKARVRAHSDDGRLFALTIERCSGEIVAARQIEYRHTNGRYDPRAYSQVPYRHRSYK